MQDKAKKADTITGKEAPVENLPAPLATPRKPTSNLLRNSLVVVALGLIAASLMMDEPAKNPDIESIQAIKASFQADGTAAREMIDQLQNSQTAVSLDTAYQQAEGFAQKGEPVNAYLMYFFAARQGHAASAMKLAQMADPVANQSGAQPYQAYKWYKAAADSGVSEARQHLDQLKQWAEASAKSGDPSAQRLLLQWQS